MHSTAPPRAARASAPRRWLTFGGLALAMLTWVIGPGGCRCDGQRANDAPTQSAGPSSAGPDDGDRAAPEASAEGTGQALASAAPEAPTPPTGPPAHRLPTTGSPVDLPDAPIVTIRATPARVTVGDTAPVVLTGEGAVEGDEQLGLELASRIREAADALFLERLETAIDPASLGDERSIVMLLEPDAATPASTLGAVLEAASDQGQTVWLAGLSPAGERRWVRHAGDGPLPWTPSQPPELVDLPERPGRPGREPGGTASADGPGRVYEVPPERAGPADVAAAREPPDDTPRPGPAWDDRDLPVHVALLPTGVSVTAGTLERRLPGLLPTGVPRDRTHPNVAAPATYTDGAPIGGWLDWAEVARQLDRARDRALAYDLDPAVRLRVPADVPAALLYRALDVIVLDVGEGARIAGASLFEDALTGGRAVPGFLPRPVIEVFPGRAGFAGRPSEPVRPPVPIDDGDPPDPPAE